MSFSRFAAGGRERKKQSKNNHGGKKLTGVPGQRPLGVETHAVKVGVVRRALDKRARAHAARRLGAVAQPRGQAARRAVGNDQLAPPDARPAGRHDRPHALLGVERRVDHLELLPQLRAGFCRGLHHARVEVDALDGRARGLAELLFRGADVADAHGRDEAAAVGKVGLVVLHELAEDAHLLHDGEGGRAAGVAAVLVCFFGGGGILSICFIVCFVWLFC